MAIRDFVVTAHPDGWEGTATQLLAEINQLTAESIPYEAGVAQYREIARGQLLGDEVGMLKLLIHEQSRKILGVHVIGEQATELVHVGLTALLAGATNDLFIRTCYNYPTLTEMYKYATYDAMGKRDAAAVLSGA